MSQRQPWRPRQGLGEEARTQEASNKGLAISLALFGSEAEAVILLIGLYGWFVWALQYGYPNEVERPDGKRSEEHTSELQSHSDLVCRLLLEKKKKKKLTNSTGTKTVNASS